MQIRLRAPVLAVDGAHIGHVRSLLLDSTSLQLKHLVVSGRRLGGVDRQIPLDHLAPRGADDDRVALDLLADAVHDLPEFVDVGSARGGTSGSQFQPPRVTGFGDLSAPIVQSRDALGTPPEGSEFAQTSPRVVPLSSDTEVVSSTSHRNLGHLFSVEYNRDGDLTSITGRQRLFRTQVVHVPADRIESVTARQVRVMIDDEVTNDVARSETEASVTLSLGEVRAGMIAWGSDGTRLGEIEEVERSGEQVRAIVIRHGLFGRLRKRLVVDVVDKVRADGVYLTLERIDFKLLPDLEN